VEIEVSNKQNIKNSSASKEILAFSLLSAEALQSNTFQPQKS
jgi:hypothetical protein